MLLLVQAHQALAAASELRILLVIDTNASKRGGEDSIHRPAGQSNLKIMREVIDSAYAADQKAFKGKMFCDVIQGDDVTPERIRKYFTALPYDSKKSLVFYYCGHGGTDPNKGHYFATSGGDILRSEVYNLMNDTGAQGVFVLSDCCSNIVAMDGNKVVTRGLLDLDLVPGDQPRAMTRTTQAGPAPVQPMQAQRRTANTKVFYDLFFRTEGVVNFTAATRGQFGWTTNIGGYFTWALADYLCSPASAIRADGKDGAVGWNDFFGRVRDRTDANFQQAKAGSPKDDLIQKSAAQVPEAFGLGGWPVQYRRQLVVKNNTGKKIQVYIRYYDLNFTKDAWEWYSPTEKGVHYALENNAVTTLKHNDWIVGAHRARIWAQTPDGSTSWNEYRDKDLNLAPKDGYRGRFEQFTFTFNP
jgi:hypothetical protein